MQSCSVKELGAFYESEFPALTQAAKANLQFLLEEVDKQEPFNEALAEDIIAKLYKREIARKAGEAAIEIINGRSNDLGAIERILSSHEYESQTKSLIPVTENLDEILKLSEEDTRWKFNIKDLRERADGVGPGIFGIIAARPELGKTAFWVSLCVAPGGFVCQGAKVLALCNEENARKVRARIYSAFTGMSWFELNANRDEAIRLYSEITGKLILYDVVGMNITAIPDLIKEHSPDILIIDQLDKIRIDGTYTRGDERLRDVYTGAREIAKQHQVAVFGISQLSAEAQDKLNVDYSMLENSRTGKAAEADLILAIGAGPNANDGFRQINIPKNKITGNHNYVTARILHNISRYEE